MTPGGIAVAMVSKQSSAPTSEATFHGFGARAKSNLVESPWRIAPHMNRFELWQKFRSDQAKIRLFC
jgi:hypothetical protein